MKITKQRLKEIIKEELSTVRESDWYDDENETRADRKYADSQAGLGDIQSTDRLTGGSPEEQMLRRIKARELLAAMSKEELKELSLSLDAETVAELRHLLANPMYGSSGVEEGKVSSHRSEVTYSKGKRGKSKKPEKKAYNKADRAQAKRDLKKLRFQKQNYDRLSRKSWELCGRKTQQRKQRLTAQVRLGGNGRQLR